MTVQTLDMGDRQREQPGFPLSRDFARVEVECGRVVLEASEWDPSIEAYRHVTLYLHPLEARLLSEELSRKSDACRHPRVPAGTGR